MDIQLEKYKLMEWLVGLTDEVLISKIKNIKQNETKSAHYAEEVSGLEKTMIASGLQDIEEGNTYTHDQVMKEIKKNYGI